MADPTHDKYGVPICPHHPVTDEPMTDVALLAEYRALHNPTNEPTGVYTGRCQYCGSTSQAWDTNWLQCNCCGEFVNTANLPPRRVENGTGRDLGPAY